MRTKRMRVGFFALASALVACATGGGRLSSDRPPLPESPRPKSWEKRRADKGSRYQALLEEQAASWRHVAKFSYQPFAFEAQIVAQYLEKHSYYLRVRLKHTQNPLLQLHAMVRSATHAVVVAANDGHSDDLLLRFVSKPQAAERISLVVVAKTNGPQPAGSHQPAIAPPLPLRGETTLRLLATTKKDHGLPAAFFAAAASHWRERLDVLPSASGHASFADARLSLWASELAARDPGPSRRTIPMPRRQPRSDLGEMMSLYTGISSVEEALQSDRGLLLGRANKAERTIAISALKGVELPEHPWRLMLAELKRPSVADPLAHVVPQEMAYFYAHDLRTLLRVKRELARRFDRLLQALEGRAGEQSFVVRYERQLAIRSSKLAEQLGHLAAKGIALITSDPLLREGTDVTLLFDIASETLLRANLDKYAEETKARRPDATVRTFELAGHHVELLATPDREVHRYLVRIGDVLAVGNSRAVIERLIAVKHQKAKSLAQSGDYRYMRARYPFTKDQEDGFIFIGDAFVAHVTSPRFKILQARRLAAKADLSAVNQSALLYGWLLGKTPRSSGELRKEGYLTADELRHDDGTTISYEPERGALSRFGRAYQLVPSIELSVDKVSMAEKRAYERFKLSYQRYWRGYIDPIAFRIRAPQSGQLECDGRMLPLIERSDYDKLLRLVGQQMMRAPDLKSGLLFSFAVGRDAELRKMADTMVTDTLRSAKVRVGWLGDWVAVGASDRGGLLDLALAMGDTPIPGMQQHGYQRLADALRDAPLFAEAHVAEPMALVGVLLALRAQASETAAGMVQWGSGTPYRQQQITEVRIRIGHQLGGTIYYTVVKDVLVISLDRGTLEERIDAHLDGAAYAHYTQPMQSILRVRPWREKSWLARVLMTLSTTQTTRAHWRALFALELLEASKQSWQAGSPAGRQRALAHLGFVPASVFGGALTVDADGIAKSAAVGSLYLPAPGTQSKTAVASSEISRSVGALKDVEFGLAFEGKGNHRGLHVRSRWFYQPQ